MHHADYNIKELALYDLPAMVDHVRRETGYDKVSERAARLLLSSVDIFSRFRLLSLATHKATPLCSVLLVSSCLKTSKDSAHPRCRQHTAWFLNSARSSPYSSRSHLLSTLVR